MDFLAEFAEGLLKFKYVGLVNLFFKLGGKHLGREFKLWLKRRRLTKEQLGRIQEMDETELLSTLPVVFAKDLSACVPISKTQRIILLLIAMRLFGVLSSEFTSLRSVVRSLMIGFAPYLKL
ncbi:MAG: hypothetical protein AUI36_16410 [Cyanobacteria bacterium 13_1_40CM_2_61_4]|nr:MAG: hypothetical protein AUI36_16410 [Cyanobacteria bacterium 13_1_40CM_2_61_4]